MTETTKQGRVLIVDDDADVLLAAEIVLKRHFGKITTADDPEKLPTLLAAGNYDVLLLDMNFTAGRTSGKEGLHWLDAVQRLSPDTKVILMTAYGAVETAVKAIKEGASDFVVKPWDNDRLVATVASTLRFSEAAKTVRELSSVQQVLTEDTSQIGREIIGALGRDGARAGPGRKGCGDGCERPDPRRERHGQGTDRESHSPRITARRPRVRSRRSRRHC